MGRNLVGSCGWLIAIGLACQPVHAGDRKSERRGHEASEEIVQPRKVQTIILRYEKTGAAEAKPFQAGYLASSARRAGGANEARHEAGAANEHKPLTLFHINSKFGDIAVEPVMGKVNGAQFSLGF
ncbi:MAG: hypothetical protein ACREIF_12080 [Chthoniobacterales bacterium]